MRVRWSQFLPALLLVATASPALAMDILWTRMTGQYAVENAPLVADLNGSGTSEIIAVNRLGQVMRWGLDGANRGPGQDGSVIQLPTGAWTSSPTLVGGPQDPRIIVASDEGLVIALNKDLQIAWQTQLSGKLVFSRAVPAVLTTAKGPGLCFGDKQGVVTCLGLDGKVLWKTELKSGECGTELQLAGAKDGGPVLLAPCGSTLHALDPDGAIRWSQHVNGPIRTRPTVFSHAGKPAVVFAAAELTAVGLDRGELLWKRPLDVEISDSIAVLPREGDNRSLLLYTGLWGNLYAVDTAGKPVWQAVFRSKCRSRPLICDLNGDGHPAIVATGYNEHLYEFNDHGTLLDNLRLSGRINASPTLIETPGQSRPDLLMVTAAEQAYRLRPGTLRSTYGQTGQPEGVTVKLAGPEAIVVDNPNGALLRVNVSCKTKQDGVVNQGAITVRSRSELPLARGAVDVHASVEDSQERELARLSEDSFPLPPDLPPPTLPAFSVWSCARVCHVRSGTIKSRPAGPWPRRNSQPLSKRGRRVGAVVALRRAEPLRARITVSPLAAADKRPFGGTLTLREVVQTGTVNGELAADALPRSAMPA